MKKYLTYIVLILALAAVGCWLFYKFFPVSKGEWTAEEGAVNNNPDVPRSGWTKDGFWISTDFPQKQKACIEIEGGSLNGVVQIPVVQNKRTSFYPTAGPLLNLFDKYPKEEVERRIKNKEPYIISHLSENISKYGKNTFFLGNEEKFLIPTDKIFSLHFPSVYSPSSTEETHELPYSEDIIGLPEGTLISHNDGAFVISEKKKSLILSPEIFESMGYKWEEVKELIPFEAKLHPNHYILTDTYSPHPNGTVISRDDRLYLVWEKELYSLTPEEKEKYFENQPVIEVEERKNNAVCQSRMGSIHCCIDNFDPRENPPDYGNFTNAILWKVGSLASEDDTDKIKWRIKRVPNKENFIHRLKGLKYRLNFLFS